MSVIAIFNATMSEDRATRESAEAALKSMNNILQACMSVIQCVEADDDVKLAASIYLKGVCRLSWKEDNALSPEDKSYFLKNIVELLASCIYNKKVSVQIVAAMANIYRLLEVRANQWSDLYTQVLQLFESNVDQLYLTGLKLLAMIFEECNVSTICDAVLERFAEPLMACIRHLGSRDEMKLALVEAIAEFLSADVCGTHMDVYTLSVKYTMTVLDEAVGPPTNSEIICTGAKCLHFECVKYVQNAEHRFNAYISDYCSLIVSILRRIGPYTSNNKKMVNVLVETVIRLFDTSKQTEGFKHVEPHLEFMIKDLMYPCMCYNEEDVELWQVDQIEATTAMKDRGYMFETPDAFFNQLIHLKPEATRGVLTFVVSRLNEIESAGADSINKSVGVPGGLDSQKDGCLRILNLIAEGVVKYEGGDVEALIKNHVFECLSGVSPFLRLRSLTAVYGLISYGAKLNNECLKMLFMCVARLLRDSELPVRCQAAQTLQPFWQLVIEEKGLPDPDDAVNKELKEFMNPYHHEVMESMFKIANEEGMMDNFDVMESISDLILAFREDIVKFAVPAVNALVGKVEVLKSASSDDTDSYINALFSITSSFDAMASILIAVHESDDEALYLQLDSIIYGVARSILELDIVDSGDLIEEVIALYSRYPRITASMLSIIPTVLSILDSEANESSDSYCIKLFSNIVGVARENLHNITVPISDSSRSMMEIIHSIVVKYCNEDKLSLPDYDDGWMLAQDGNVIFVAWDLVCLLLEFQLDLPRQESINLFHQSCIEIYKPFLQHVKEKLEVYTGTPSAHRNNADYQDSMILDGTFAVRVWATLFLYDPEVFMAKIGNFQGTFDLVSQLVESHCVKSLISSKTFLLCALKMLSLSLESDNMELKQSFEPIQSSVVHAVECLGLASAEYVARYTDVSWEEILVSPVEYEWVTADEDKSAIRNVKVLDLLAEYIQKGSFGSMRDQLVQAIERHQDVMLEVKKI